MRRVGSVAVVGLVVLGVSMMTAVPARTASAGCVVDPSSAVVVDPVAQQIVIRVKVWCATATIEVTNTAAGRDCGMPRTTEAVDPATGVVTSTTTVDCLVVEGGVMAIDSDLVGVDPLVPAAMRTFGAGTALATAGQPETITSTVEVGTEGDSARQARRDTDVVVRLASSEDTRETRLQLLACLGGTDLPPPGLASQYRQPRR